ncbi:MAG: substrate-binding periplasmic protein [Solidesulfovibrio sp. DCME]|uniref:substrate-binding periplasmic protein n=1 Tax=Solidesulfovibrio sp. DCME TaxID=3447380 RepID=UPI003D103BD5
MKRLALLGCCWLVAALFPAALRGADPSLAGGPNGNTCQAIVYSTNPHYPPYDWAVSDAAFDGASIELLTRVVPEGVTLKPLVLPWKRALYLAGQGEIDLLVSLRITPEREQYLDFTNHRAFPNPIVAFVRKDRAFPYHGWDDLRGRLGGVSLGDTFGGGFDEYLRANLRVEQAPSMEENFRKLAAGRIDYCVTSLYVGQAYLARHPLAQAIVALEPPISNQDIHFAMSKRSPCLALLDRISRALAQLDAQGVPEALLHSSLRRYQEHVAETPK